MLNLQDLRNVIVHRLGKPGEAIEQRKDVDRLLQYYEGTLAEVKQPGGFDSELDVSRQLCDHFVEQVAAFFRRLFIAADMLDEDEWFPTEPTA